MNDDVPEGGVTSARVRLEQAIAALEAQREALGDSVVDASIAAMREKLASFEPPPAADQQRKQVTILFADVVGSTQMGERLDPEAVMEIMSGGLRAFGDAVEQHQGVVTRLMGDGLLALFGTPAAREDDPERAVRAGLAIVGAAKSYARQVAERWGVGAFSVRVGINTGLVALGAVGGAGREFTAMGDATNLAARLTSTAPADGVMIAHDTYQHVRGLFSVRRLEPLLVKGKSQPVEAYLVIRAKPRAFRIRQRGVEGIETRMIGREAELKQLKEALYGAIEDGEGQVITVVGEAGVGKSRLIHEFDKWVELLPESVFYFKGRATHEMQKMPYALVRDLFAFRFQIRDSDRPAVVRKKIEHGIGEVMGEGGEMRGHFIGQLLGYDFRDSPHLMPVLDDAKQIRNRALVYMGEYFKAIASVEPGLILLEDIHWADDGSLGMLSQLARMSQLERLLFVFTARPALFERRPHFGEGQPFHTRLALYPLSKRDSRRLFGEIMQRTRDVPAALRELVVNGADGNPFYIEELIKMLIQDGVIVKGDPDWTVEPGRLASIRVPSSLIGILQARLDGLSVEERTALQRASVVGRRFWDSTVERLSKAAEKRMSGEEIHSALSAARQKEMIYRREVSAFADTEEYLFKHAILREVTYESVLMRERRRYHELVAEWLIERSGERAGEYTGLIADHLELAGRVEEARTYLRRAAQNASSQYANAEAIGYLTRALDLTPDEEHSERFEIVLHRERLHDLVGDRQGQLRDVDRLHELAEAMDNDELRTTARLRRARCAHWMGDYPEAIATAREAIALAQAVGSVASEAEGYEAWGRALVRQAEYEAAGRELDRALTLAREAGVPNLEAGCLLVLGIAKYNQGDYARAKTYYEEALQLCRTFNYPTNESAALINLGAIAYNQGDYASARAYYEQALHLKRRIGDRHGEGLTLGNLANIALDQGDYDAATEKLAQSLSLCREIGEPYGESNALCNLGMVACEQGDYDAARVHFEKSLHLYLKHGDRYGECHALAGTSLLLHNLGDDETALVRSEEALHIARDVALRSVEAEALTTRGHALVALGRFDEARNAYGKAVEMRRGLGEHKLALEPLAGLAAIALAEGNLAEAQTLVDEILEKMATRPLESSGKAFRVYLACYRVLRANQSPRADEVLDKAHRQLQATARSIGDQALRASYLQKVPVHRAILTEARAHGLAERPVS